MSSVARTSSRGFEDLFETCKEIVTSPLNSRGSPAAQLRKPYNIKGIIRGNRDIAGDRFAAVKLYPEGETIPATFNDGTTETLLAKIVFYGFSSDLEQHHILTWRNRVGFQDRTGLDVSVKSLYTELGEDAICGLIDELQDV